MNLHFRACPKKCVNGEIERSIFTIGEHTWHQGKEKQKSQI